jgi:hypothetical protein
MPRGTHGNHARASRQHVEDCDRDGVPGDPMGVGAWLDDIAAAVEAAGRE